LLTAAVPPSYLEWNSSARSVDELAAATLTRRLILSHLIPPSTTADDEDAFLDEVRSGGYLGPIDVARDLLRVGASS
jgi:ribonuclease BN (tRNA processing enzyme)